MAELKASESGLIRIKQARNEKGWTVEDPRWLVEASKILNPSRDWDDEEICAEGISEGTWKAFLYKGSRSRGIQSKVFKAYCAVLNLEWEEIVERPMIPNPLPENPSVLWQEVCQEVRSRCCEKIQRHYNKIGLINSKPIEVDALYIDVYVLQNFSDEIPADETPKNYDAKSDRCY